MRVEIVVVNRLPGNSKEDFLKSTLRSGASYQASEYKRPQADQPYPGRCFVKPV